MTSNGFPFLPSRSPSLDLPDLGRSVVRTDSSGTSRDDVRSPPVGRGLFVGSSHARMVGPGRTVTGAPGACRETTPRVVGTGAVRRFTRRKPPARGLSRTTDSCHSLLSLSLFLGYPGELVSRTDTVGRGGGLVRVHPFSGFRRFREEVRGRFESDLYPFPSPPRRRVYPSLPKHRTRDLGGVGVRKRTCG